MIDISKKDGIFQRVVDTWSCLGGSLALSEYLPMFEGDEIGFQINQMPLFKETKCLELAQLLRFNPHGNRQPFIIILYTNTAHTKRDVAKYQGRKKWRAQKKGKREYLNDIQTKDFTAKISDYLKHLWRFLE